MMAAEAELVGFGVCCEHIQKCGRRGGGGGHDDDQVRVVNQDEIGHKMMLEEEGGGGGGRGCCCGFLIKKYPFFPRSSVRFLWLPRSLPPWETMAMYGVDFLL